MRRNVSRLRRSIALLTAVCCFWLGTVGSLLHTHGSVLEARSTSLVASAPANHLGHAVLQGSHSKSDRSQCLACEWQATIVSPALTAFELPQVERPPLPEVALAASYHQFLSHYSPSRAPPTV
jgi:hypothetical protein